MHAPASLIKFILVKRSAQIVKQKSNYAYKLGHAKFLPMLKCGNKSLNSNQQNDENREFSLVS